jgi:Rhodanese-related sulfurtransferase
MISLLPSSQKKSKCEEMYKKYHSKFSSIETLTSADFLQDYYCYTSSCDDHLHGKTNLAVTLVDVRTRAEQKVSMIPGAITLHEFESQLKQHPNKWQDDGQLVVTYCTIGYRSGLEAQRLRQVYNIGNIRHLDGIVPYTHACAAFLATTGTTGNNSGVSLAAVSNKSPLVQSMMEIKGKGDDDKQENARMNEPKRTNNATPMAQPDIPYLINPKTKKSTQKVHVFGSTWDIASDNFQTVWFSKLDMALKGVTVGFKAALVQFKETFQKCYCCSWCCSSSSCRVA